MKKITLALTALAAMASPMAIAAPAEAANPACMSRAEYSRIHKGMTPTQVTRIVGSAGRSTMDAGWMKIRQWNHCGSPFGLGQVTYTNGRVNNKLMI